MADLTFGAIIPAAGLSSRMEGFKPLLKIGDQTLTERLIELFNTAGVHEVVVVAGHRGDELNAALKGTSCRITVNSGYKEGMFSSVQAGIRELKGRCDAFFVLPVDIPLVRPMTIRRLLERFAEPGALVCHPVFQSQRGHPPLVDSSLIENLLGWHGEGGLKVFLEQYSDHSVEVPVADAWIRRDVDTEAELAALRRDLERYTIPTQAECDVILQHCLEVPGPVQAHSRAVADVAVRLGRALNSAGQNLDLNLLTASGLLHDCFKGHKDHAGRAAGWLRENGFPEVAAAVAVHIDIPLKEKDTIDESALLYLADKVVEGERLITVRERMDALLDRYGHDEEARQAIRSRLEKAARIQAAVEKIMGRSFTEFMGTCRK